MSVTPLPDGGTRYENTTASYAVVFGPGWTLNAAFPRHDFQATCSAPHPSCIFGVNVFTQYLPELAQQSQTDFLDNFGHGDFDAMVHDSFETAFDVRPRTTGHVRQLMVRDRVWFLGNYHLVGRSSGTSSELRYGLTFQRGYFYHVKAFLDPRDLATADASVEALAGGFEIR